MHSTFLTDTVLKRGAIALMLMAAVFAVGFGAQSADAQAPVVSAGGPYQAFAGQAIELSGTTDVAAVAAQWNFSDGVSLPGLSVVRAFSAPGTYTATLTVVDSAGFSYSASTTVTVFATDVTSTILNQQALLSSLQVFQSEFGPVVQLADGTLVLVSGQFLNGQFLNGALLNAALFNGQFLNAAFLTSPLNSVCMDPNFALTPFCQNM
jgi:hypothetical protein